MTSVLVPIDFEALAYRTLSVAFPTVNVGALIEGDTINDPDLPYIGFAVLPGRRINQITDLAHILVRVWDTNDASLLCRKAYAVLLAANENTIVRRTESVAGPAEWPDVNPTISRYQATVEWQARPEEQTL